MGALAGWQCRTRNRGKFAFVASYLIDVSFSLPDFEWLIGEVCFLPCFRIMIDPESASLPVCLLALKFSLFLHLLRHTWNVCYLLPGLPVPLSCTFALPHLLTDSSKSLCFACFEGEKEGGEGCGLEVGG